MKNFCNMKRNFLNMKIKEMSKSEAVDPRANYYTRISVIILPMFWLCIHSIPICQADTVCGLLSADTTHCIHHTYTHFPALLLYVVRIIIIIHIVNWHIFTSHSRIRWWAYAYTHTQQEPNEISNQSKTYGECVRF